MKDKPYFDLERAKNLINKTMLIGVSYYSHNGKFIERKQLHGKIVEADATKGFVIQLEGSRAGETFHLPPDLRLILDAPQGTYKVYPTGEEIVNPDYLSSWVINKPPPGKSLGLT
jgi:hypothetical protein